MARDDITILSRDELMGLADPTWLVESLIPQDSFVEIFGMRKSYKTFLSAAIAGSVATGLPFLGKHVISAVGDVAYVCAEGPRGFRRRIKAWELHNNTQIPTNRLSVVPHSIDLQDPGHHRVLKLIDKIRQRGLAPVLIVIDTLARCFSGDENSTKDMNAFVAHMDELREAFPGCTVLVVHHVGWAAGKRSRGNSALEGALDTAIRVEKPRKGLMKMAVVFQKEWETDENPVFLAMKSIPAAESIVFELVDPIMAGQLAAAGKTEETILAPLVAAGVAGLTTKQWQEACPDTNTNTYKSARGRLKENGDVELRGSRWFAVAP
jgi:hypothetical protein